MSVSLDIRVQIPFLAPNGTFTPEVRQYMEKIYRAKCEELAAMRQLLGYADEKSCPNCKFKMVR